MDKKHPLTSVLEQDDTWREAYEWRSILAWLIALFWLIVLGAMEEGCKNGILILN